MRLLYDAGVLIAAERGDRGLWSDHRARLELGFLPLTTAPIVAQTSRSPCQVDLRRFLRGCDTAPFATDEAHATGALAATAGTADVVDAHLVLVAARAGGRILTSDRRDLETLAAQLPIRPVIISM